MLTKDMAAGAIGQIGIAVARAAFLLIVEGSNVGFAYFMFLNIIDSDILITSFVLLLVAAASLPRKFRGSSWGILSVILGIATGLILLALYAEGIMGMNYVPGYTFVYVSEYLYAPNVVGYALILISDFTFGFSLAALGGFFLSCRRSLAPSQLWIATGIAYFAAAVFQISLIITEPSYIILIGAGIIGAACMLISKPRFPRK
jgi:hypothetical protein